MKNFQCKGSPNSLGSAINSPSAENTIFDKDSERLIPDALTIASFRHQQTNPRISRSLSDAANIHWASLGWKANLQYDSQSRLWTTSTSIPTTDAVLIADAHQSPLCEILIDGASLPLRNGLPVSDLLNNQELSTLCWKCSLKEVVSSSLAAIDWEFLRCLRLLEKSLNSAMLTMEASSIPKQLDRCPLQSIYNVSCRIFIHHAD